LHKNSQPAVSPYRIIDDLDTRQDQLIIIIPELLLHVLQAY